LVADLHSKVLATLDRLKRAGFFTGRQQGRLSLDSVPKCNPSAAHHETSLFCSRPVLNRRMDVEIGRVRPLDGFPSLSDFIASDHDRTSLVFRRFDRLAARNLLYLQSELAALEAKLVGEAPSRLTSCLRADNIGFRIISMQKTRVPNLATRMRKIVRRAGNALGMLQMMSAIRGKEVGWSL
jgi:hypothetical protein